MSNQNIAYAFIGGSALIAVAATWGVFALIDSYQQQAYPAEKAVKTITVVAASRTLYQGVEITNDDLFVLSIPPEFLPKITATDAKAKTTSDKKAETFRSRERVVGQVPREKILKNELIRPERLADGQNGVGLNAVVARGMRALSLDLRGADAITGFLTPGNYVDVLVTLEDELGNLRTEPLIQSVFVLGVNSKAENENDGDVFKRGKQKPTVTFMLTPEQVEEMAMASEIGKISLGLRNVQDVGYTNIPVAQLSSVLRHVTGPSPVLQTGDEAPSRPPVARYIPPVAWTPPAAAAPAPAPAPVAAADPAAPSGPSITFIRGGVASTVTAQEQTMIHGAPDEKKKK